MRKDELLFLIHNDENLGTKKRRPPLKERLLIC